MRTVGNILWFCLAGIWLAIGYALAGVVCFILIITIPFGIASFRLAGFVLWPFGRTVVRRPTAGAMSAIGNVIWFVVAGVWIAIEHVLVGLLLCVTIIGIPFGIASFKLAGLALFPLGKQVVPASSVAPADQLVTMP
jgi:uncharacterized membrane protein YccF (DUF307 family)